MLERGGVNEERLEYRVPLPDGCGFYGVVVDDLVAFSIESGDVARPETLAEDMLQRAIAAYAVDGAAAEGVEGAPCCRQRDRLGSRGRWSRRLGYRGEGEGRAALPARHRYIPPDGRDSLGKVGLEELDLFLASAGPSSAFCTRATPSLGKRPSTSPGNSRWTSATSCSSCCPLCPSLVLTYGGVSERSCGRTTPRGRRRRLRVRDRRARVPSQSLALRRYSRR